MAIDRLNMRGAQADHTVSLSPPRGFSGERFYLSLGPDSPLTYGYEEAGTHLDRESLARLLHWLQTGEALPVGDERIAVADRALFGGAPPTDSTAIGTAAGAGAGAGAGEK